MNTPKDGFRIVWFILLEAATSFAIITVSLMSNLFVALLLASLLVYIGIKIVIRFSKTARGQAYIAHNLSNTSADTAIDDAPMVLKTALESWRLVLIAPFRLLAKTYALLLPNVARLNVATKESAIKEAPQKLVTQKI